MDLHQTMHPKETGREKTDGRRQTAGRRSLSAVYHLKLSTSSALKNYANIYTEVQDYRHEL